MVGAFEQNDGSSKVHDGRIKCKTVDQGRGTLEGMCTRGTPCSGSHHSPHWALWQNTLRLMLARAESVTAAHSSEYNTGAEIRP